MGIDQCSHCAQKTPYSKPHYSGMGDQISSHTFENLQWIFHGYNSNQLTAGKKSTRPMPEYTQRPRPPSATTPIWDNNICQPWAYRGPPICCVSFTGGASLNEDATYVNVANTPSAEVGLPPWRQCSIKECRVDIAAKSLEVRIPPRFANFRTDLPSQIWPGQKQVGNLHCLTLQEDAMWSSAAKYSKIKQKRDPSFTLSSVPNNLHHWPRFLSSQNSTANPRARHFAPRQRPAHNDDAQTMLTLMHESGKRVDSVCQVHQQWFPIEMCKNATPLWQQNVSKLWFCRGTSSFFSLYTFVYRFMSKKHIKISG